MNGAIDELKFFKTKLGEDEIKKIFINTGRSLEGYYPLGEKIDNTGQVKDLSGNGFHGQLKDQNKNNATSITASQNYEIKLSSTSPSNNRSSYFDRDRFVEVPYQEKLNPEKFTLVGWIKPNNDLHTMEGILSSEYDTTGYGCVYSSSKS